MSSLAAQIQRLNASSQNPDSVATKKGRPVSLLFSPTDAAEVDAVSLLELARQALSELLTQERRFAEFSSTLFHATSSSLDRGVLTPEENERLDTSVTRCLLLLSPYAATKTAHRVLEYLIRQYNIERLNVDALMDCCLAFHDTRMFFKLVKILHLDGERSMWGFLRVCKQRGPLSRAMLAERVAHDPSLASFLGSMVFRAAECASEAGGGGSRDWESKVSWYAATLTAAIDTTSPSEDFLRALVPQLLKGLALKGSPAVQVGCYVVTMKISSTNLLSPSVSEVLLAAVLKSPAPQYGDHAMACAATIVNNSEWVELPNSVHRYVASGGGSKGGPGGALGPLEDRLARVANDVDVSRFASALLKHVVDHVALRPEFADHACRLLASSSPSGGGSSGLMPLSSVAVAAAVRTVAGACLSASPAPSEDALDRLARVLAACAQHHSAACDATLKDMVRSLGAQGQERQRDAVMALLSRGGHAGSGSLRRHTPLEDTGTTLYLALEHADASVREKAVLRALEMAETGDGSWGLESGGGGDLQACLLRRLLHDDAPKVVTSVARHPAVVISALANACKDSGGGGEAAVVENVWKAFRRWSDELWVRPEANAPVVAGLLAVLRGVVDHLNARATSAVGGDHEVEAVRERAVAMATLAHLEHLPTGASTHFTEAKLSGAAQKDIAELWVAAAAGCAALAKTSSLSPATTAAVTTTQKQKRKELKQKAGGPFAANSLLALVPELKAETKKTSKSSSSTWAGAVSAGLAPAMANDTDGDGNAPLFQWTKIAGGGVSHIVVKYGEPLRVPPAVRMVLLEAVGAAVPSSSPGGGLEVAHRVLRSALVQLGSAALGEKDKKKRDKNKGGSVGLDVAAAWQSAVLTLLSKVVTAATTTEAASSESSAALTRLTALILRLPPIPFADPKAHAALRLVISKHLRMRPLPALADVFAAADGGPESEEGGQSSYLAATTARLRAFGLATSYLEALVQQHKSGGGGAGPPSSSSKAVVEAALVDAACVLPHVLSTLEHPSKAVREAGLALLASVAGLGKLDSALSAPPLPFPPTLVGAGAPPVPATKAAEFLKMCGMVLSRRAEISMDPLALGPCLASMFLHDTPDRAWKKVRTQALHCLLATVCNLGFVATSPSSSAAGAGVVCERVLSAMAWRLDGKARTVLQVCDDQAMAWPLCEQLATSALANNASNKSESDSESGGLGSVLKLLLDEFVFTPAASLAAGNSADSAASKVALVEAVLRNATNSSSDPKKTQQQRQQQAAVTSHCLGCMAKAPKGGGWSAALTKPQTVSLFNAMLAVAHSSPGAHSQLLRSAFGSLEQLDPEDFSAALRAWAAPTTEAGDSTTAKLTAVLEAMATPMERLQVSSPAKALLALVDDLFLVLEKINDRQPPSGSSANDDDSSSDDDAVRYCQSRVLELALGVLKAHAAKDLPGASKGLAKKVGRYAEALGAFLDNRDDTEALDAGGSGASATGGSAETATRVLAVLAELSPKEMLGSVTLMVRKLATESAGEHKAAATTTLKSTEQVLVHVLPHLRAHGGGKGMTAGTLLWDLSRAIQGATQQRKLSVCNSLLHCLSSDVLPALVLLLVSAGSRGDDQGDKKQGPLTGSGSGDDLMIHRVAHRASPRAQVSAAVKLLQVAHKCCASLNGGGDEKDDDDDFVLSLEPEQEEEGAAASASLTTSSFMSLNLGLVLAGGSSSETHKGKKLALACRCAQFVADHLESRALHFQLLRLSEEDEGAIQKMYLHVCQQLLLCMRQTAEASAVEEDLSSSRESTAGAMLVALRFELERVLSNLQGLLSVAGFIAVVQELLVDDDAQVREKALELLARRIHGMQRGGDEGGNGITRDEASLFVDMLPDLAAVVELTTSVPKADGAADDDDDDDEQAVAHGDFQASALCAVDILARAFAPTHPESFLPMLGHVIVLLERHRTKGITDAGIAGENGGGGGGGEDLLGRVSSAAFLCAATVCGVLGTRAFPHLPKLMPLALDHLEALNAITSSGESGGSEEVVAAALSSVLSALVAAAQSFPQFLHPYLARIVAQTHQGRLLLSPHGGHAGDDDEGGVGGLVRRLHLSLASGVPLRLMLPVLLRTFEGAVAAGWGEVALRRLVTMFQSTVEAASQRDVKMHLAHLSLFLMIALSFREGRVAAALQRREGGGDGDEELELELVEGVESAVVEALVCVVMRMNENELAAFFIDLYEWKLKDQEGDGSDEAATPLLARRVTFFHVTSVLAERLKSIFVPYFEHFFEDCCAELAAPFQEGKDEANSKASAKKKRKLSKTGKANGVSDSSDSVLAAQGVLGHSLLCSTLARTLQWRLLRSVVASLQHCFEHDESGVGGSGFMTKERVEAVAQPLVRTIALAPLDRAFVHDAVAPCVAQLASAAASDVLWKPLNHQVLLSTRDPVAAVRLAALNTLHACFSLVGEEYLVMLPESLSFLSELLEDSDAMVEAKCREILKFVEGLSGEELDTYL